MKAACRPAFGGIERSGGAPCSSEFRKEHIASHEPINLHSGSTHLDTIHPGSVAIDMTTVAMTTIVSIVKDQKLQVPHRVGECGRGRW